MTGVRRCHSRATVRVMVSAILLLEFWGLPVEGLVESHCRIVAKVFVDVCVCVSECVYVCLSVCVCELIIRVCIISIKLPLFLV